jgi:hypothetical protein
MCGANRGDAFIHAKPGQAAVMSIFSHETRSLEVEDKELLKNLVVIFIFHALYCFLFLLISDPIRKKKIELVQFRNQARSTSIQI